MSGFKSSIDSSSSEGKKKGEKRYSLNFKLTKRNLLVLVSLIILGLFLLYVVWVISFYLLAHIMAFWFTYFSSKFMLWFMSLLTVGVLAILGYYLIAYLILFSQERQRASEGAFTELHSEGLSLNEFGSDDVERSSGHYFGDYGDSLDSSPYGDADGWE